MKIIHCTQGEGDWLQARTGRVTASEVGAALSTLVRNGKEGRKAGDSSAEREHYMAALVGEILTGSASEHYVSKDMDRGTQQEQFARAAYEARFEVMVDQVGFVLHPTIDRSGASPDGIIDINGGLEIKVPRIDTHVRYARAGVLPSEYEPQVMWNIACAEREWWDFISFCPEMPPRHQIFRKRVYRDDTRIAQMVEGVLRFLSEADALIEELNLINPEIAEAAQEIEHPEDFLSEEELDAVFGRKA